MAAKVTNIAGISDPNRLILALYLPLSGAVNDVRCENDQSVLGALTIADGGPGVWTVTAVNDFPTKEKLLITSGANVAGAGSGDTGFTVSTILTSAKVLQIILTSVNATTPVNLDTDAWVKVERSVF